MTTILSHRKLHLSGTDTRGRTGAAAVCPPPQEKKKKKKSCVDICLKKSEFFQIIIPIIPNKLYSASIIEDIRGMFEC